MAARLICDWPAVLAQAKADGICKAQVARNLGCSPPSVTRQCARLQVSLPNGRYRPDRKVQDWVAALREARRQGLNVTETAKALNVSACAVSRATRKHGIYLKGQYPVALIRYAA